MAHLSPLRDQGVVSKTVPAIHASGAGCDLNLNDKGITTPHSVIQMHEAQFVIVGLNQAAMPLQNGIPVQSRAVLADRDLIEMGTSAVRVRLLNSTD